MNTKSISTILTLGILLSANLASAFGQPGSISELYLKKAAAARNKAILQKALVGIKEQGCDTNFLRTEKEYSTTFVETHGCICSYTPETDGNNNDTGEVNVSCVAK